MKKNSSYLFGGALGLVLLGCGGGGALGGPSVLGLGAFTAELVGTAQPPVTVSSSLGANATGIAGAQFDNLMFTATGANTLSDTKIAFASTRDGNAEIYTSNHDGTNPVRLTNQAGPDESPSFSPDGSKIVFVSGRDGNSEIYVMNVNGTSQTRLTNNASSDSDPTWSPDGTMIAFTSSRDGNSEVYTMNANGSSQTRRTTESGTDSAPSWSPDGTKIIFHSNRDGDYEIFSMFYTGIAITQLTDNPATESFPSWSRDGNFIAFTSTRDGNSEIYSMAADGSNQIRRTTNTASDFAPVYSPDGSKILFTSQRDGINQAYMMNASGSSQVSVSRSPFSEYEVAWSGFLPRATRTLIGPSGTLGTTGAGFIFTQERDQVLAILGFDTTSPTVSARAAARVVAQNPGDSSVSTLIFAITTTSGLASIKYAPVSENGTPGTVSTFTMASGMTAALVSFSGSTGLLGSVLPYTATRAPLSKPTRVGNEVTYTGSFGEILDGAGKVIAPAGATSVTIDERTGKVVRFQK
ncbi:MAG TPA: DUF5050 domain-containing protein [Fimbriimonas sp.]|nr:DUF5050 domain-containing protein [Fimbriimonas sp.]